jgi:hypothetical protein
LGLVKSGSGPEKVVMVIAATTATASMASLSGDEGQRSDAVETVSVGW